ncbi:MAG: hypothetical protein JW891_11445 [Candidatus Lokiarchaeota archaeon]|nr:hypothetical protein [Candidatus Lokiarchaeota archaeon]
MYNNRGRDMAFDGINCVECGGSEFRLVNDSILKRKFPFVRGDNLKMCEKCGAKYITCDKCGNLFTRVHLSTDLWGVTDTCPSCNALNEEIKAWIARGHP